MGGPADPALVPRPSSPHPLLGLLRPLWSVGLSDAGERAATDAQIVCRAGQAPPQWLRADGWQALVRPAGDDADLGESFQAFTGDDGTTVHARQHPDGRIAVPFSFAEAYDAFVAERWRTISTNRRLSESQLALFYRVRRLIPRGTQLAARRLLISIQGTPAFPAWPLDTSVSDLLRFFAGCALRAAGREAGEFVWFWPEGRHAAIVLTHDVEGPEGIRLALQLADLEEAHGFRSSFNFGGWYEVDSGVLRELRDRGFEIGLHGLVHDRTLFSSRQAFDASRPALADLADRLGAVGFRSPATHRVHEWIAELPVSYDCTVPNSDPYEPQPGGCCSVWPFFIGPVVELPYTMPQDHTVLTLLRRRSPGLWLEQAARIEREHGLIQCVSHPDPGYLGDADKRAVYAEFLRGMAERRRVWRALPRQVADWWRERAGSEAAAETLPRGTARIGTAGTVELAPPA